MSDRPGGGESTLGAPQDARVHAPARGNKRLERLLEAVDGDLQVKAWWHAAGVNAERLHMSDHSWVHIPVSYTHLTLPTIYSV